MKKSNIYSILAILSFTLMFTACDTGGEDDGTVANWFLPSSASWHG